MNLFILNANALQIPLADKSVNMCVTSPPYYGLRNYNVDGQIGLEESMQDYINNIVLVFREVWRVMKDDGVLFLNLGDSYFSGGQRVNAYGTSDKEPVNYQGHGCLCENLCGECREVYQNRISHKDSPLVAMLTALQYASIRENKAAQIDHLPTLDLIRQVDHNSNAKQDQANNFGRVDEQLRAFLVSMIGESSPQLLDVYLQKASRGECLLCDHSSISYDRQFFHKLDDCQGQQQHIQDSASRGVQLEIHNQYKDKVCEYCNGIYSYHNYTTAYHNLKPKDLIGIPWRVAFALQADGWYLRQDIIWHKPNPMPESVKDRCTKAHEYIFLLSKSQRYYYDADAIMEVATGYDGRKDTKFKGSLKYKDSGQTFAERGNERLRYKNLQPDGQQPNTMHIKRLEGEEYLSPVRNKRSVWTVTTKGYPEAHFATYPPDLITDCIKAGSKPGGVVLDPFNGSGTTGEVCARYGRNYVGVELNREYIGLTNKRLLQYKMQPNLFA